MEPCRVGTVISQQLPKKSCTNHAVPPQDGQHGDPGAEQGPVSRIIEGTLRITGRIIGGIGSLLYSLIVPDEEGEMARQNFTSRKEMLRCAMMKMIPVPQLFAVGGIQV